MLSSWDKRGGDGFGFMLLSVDLSEEGMNHTDEIVKLVFQYVNLLKKEGPKEWIFEEFQTLNTIRFRFKDKERPGNYVVELSGCLHKYPIEETLTGGIIPKEYRPDVINSLVDCLTPEKLRVTLVAKQFQNEVDSKDPFYGTDYSFKDISPEKIEQWRNAGVSDELYLPKPNQFLPSNTGLVPRDPVLNKAPDVIKNDEYCRVWFAQDNDYLLPKAMYAFEFLK